MHLLVIALLLLMLNFHHYSSQTLCDGSALNTHSIGMIIQYAYFNGFILQDILKIHIFHLQDALSLKQ